MEHGNTSEAAPERSAKKGFTLIELLVVIAIIGILSSIVLASLSSARARASRVATLAALRGVLDELEMCNQDGGAAPTIQLDPTMYVCADLSGDPTGHTPFGTHTIKWPPLPSGWSYGTNATTPSTLPSGSLVSGYSYSAILTGTTGAVSVGGADLVQCGTNPNLCQ